MASRAFAVGCSGPRLTERERAFFRNARPCGLILFQRNCRSPEQLRALAAEAREATGSGAFLVLIDQEGGRVRRLRPPTWREYPSARAFGRAYAQDHEKGLEAAQAAARLTADDLHAADITFNCAPVLDLAVPGAHDVIGDRAYDSEPKTVIALGRAVADGYMSGGVVPVIKHVPGHGRACVDSHESLPVIEASRQELADSDFKPFAALADMPAAMTAHLLLAAFDAERPVSVSPTIIGQVIRGRLGFGGLLFSDDLSMRALSGMIAERARDCIAAGCDIVLHCNADLSEMEKVAEVVPELAGRALARFERALEVTETREPYDKARAERLLAEVVALARQ